MSTPESREPEVDHTEVHRREQRDTEPEGPSSRTGGPLTWIWGAVAVLLVLWVVVASGWVL